MDQISLMMNCRTAKRCISIKRLPCNASQMRLENIRSPTERPDFEIAFKIQLQMSCQTDMVLFPAGKKKFTEI